MCSCVHTAHVPHITHTRKRKRDRDRMRMNELQNEFKVGLVNIVRDLVSKGRAGCSSVGKVLAFHTQIPGFHPQHSE